MARRASKSIVLVRGLRQAALGLLVLGGLAVLVGAAILCLRFAELDLAAGAALSDVPAEIWLETGLRALLIPWLASLAIASLALAATRGRPDSRRRARWIAAVTVVGIVPALAVALSVAQAEMRPMAAVLAGGHDTIGGYLVGETSKRTYVVTLPRRDATDAFDGSPGKRLISVASTEIERSAEGDPESVGGARSQESVDALVDRLRPHVSSVRGVSREQLAIAFSPLVHLHRRERRLPMSADEFIERSALKFAHDEFCPDETVAVGAARRALRRKVPTRLLAERLGKRHAYSRLQASGTCRPDMTSEPVTTADHSRPWDADRPRELGIKEGFYLDLADWARSGEEAAREGHQRVVRGVRAYYEDHPESVEGRPGRRLTYWLLYGMNEGVDREGDWERVSVLVRRERNSRYLPVSVRFHYYSPYDLRRDVPWPEVERVTASGEPGAGATHPVVYGALGSHAPYWREGRFRLSLDGSGEFHVDDRGAGCASCPRWRTWEQLEDARQEPWYGFGGAWGEAPGGGNSIDTGPLGPSRYKLEGRDRQRPKSRIEAPVRSVTADVEELERVPVPSRGN